MEIGFIGTGVMGSGMITNLLKAGYQVNIYNRTKSKAQSLIADGAIWQASPQAVAEASQIIFTIVGYPSDVEMTYFGEQGIFAATMTDKIVVDMTTSTPTLAKKIADAAVKQGAQALDAPVSGGDIGAKNATLTIMVGGDAATFQQVLPIFEKIGKKIVLQGAAGSGQHTKMANQIMVAGTMLGLSEMLVYAKAANLDLEATLQVVGGGAAANWSLDNYGPRILREDYSPGFFIKHFIKDLKIALTEAKALNLNLPMTELAEKLYAELAAEGYENSGTQALIQRWWQAE
ncbi:3-hydroxyisobutyrate dehydrogenase [Enterococcus sp. PF1-24]|uniref:NAD(P)-dependent oxidoreductase n=1 Tax=unclassified Enterococcus TaxID=2608891 RepID=UPI002472F2F2|nr:MULTISPECIES: NAD(P)-dependent oxidoreductase [unclassified Enterococcus]MDH6363637.1 3-hydroxyisobutyrate dehydrogenase [Enterococcus sp. PFB1-1]MDH6400872.1 3-hydroxyisobutyrate dehydrogenase [Enterococcus sp. PF1-24]